MKTKTKLTEISELKDFKPIAGTIYLYKGIVVPCPDCSQCKIEIVRNECIFKTYEIL